MNRPVQYTIRNIPSSVDATLKAQAKKQGISLNRLVLDKLGASPKTTAKPKTYHDLDWFIGSGIPAELEQIQRDIQAARLQARKLAQTEYEAEKARGKWD